MKSAPRGKKKYDISESPSMSRFRSEKNKPIVAITESPESPQKYKSSYIADSLSIAAQTSEQIAIQNQLEADHLTSALLRVLCFLYIVRYFRLKYLLACFYY
jgi:hypothetical protein